MDLKEIERQTQEAAQALLETAALRAGEILVVGCSTSEIGGQRIGTAGCEGIAAAVLRPLLAAARARGVYLAVQCCEHLNRALVVERAALERYGLEEVQVVPVPHAGGSLAAAAMRQFDDPAVAETVAAHAGLDIGATLIGMHLKRVAVPVRLPVRQIGQAALTAARTRPKLIGGSRAVYERAR